MIDQDAGGERKGQVMKRYELMLAAKPEPKMVECENGDYMRWADYQAGTCGTCGRSLPSDGECNGCRVDKLRDTEIAGLKAEAQKNIRCSFCGKQAKEVLALIAGNTDAHVQVYICDECLEVSAELVEKRKAERESDENKI